MGSGLPWVEPISFEDFHRDRLPALVAKHGVLVAGDLAGAVPLAFRLPDRPAWTWLPAAEGVRVVAGEGAAETVVELDEATFSEFIHPLITASGAVMTGRARILRGVLPAVFLETEPGGPSRSKLVRRPSPLVRIAPFIGWSRLPRLSLAWGGPSGSMERPCERSW